MNNRRRTLLWFCLAAALTLCILVGACSPAEGIDHFEDMVANDETVWFGRLETNHGSTPGVDAEWYVAGYNGKGAAASGKITMLLKEHIKNSNLFGRNNNSYINSELYAMFRDVLYFDDTNYERSAVVPRSYAGGATYDGANTDGVAGAAVNNVSFWPLSTKEANAVASIAPGKLAFDRIWWLCSPGDTDTKAAYVTAAGVVQPAGLLVNSQSPKAARAAFYLNEAAVLFMAAPGSKPASVSADLTQVGNGGSEWTLTLLDDGTVNYMSGHVGFSAKAGSGAKLAQEEGYSGWSVPVKYSGANTGDREFVSAAICDASGKPLYYGNIAKSSASGTATVNIPSGLKKGTYTLYVFAESIGGGKSTDYASALKAISLTVGNVAPAPVPPQPTSVPVPVTGDAAHPALWAALCLFAAAGLFAAGLALRRAAKR